MGAVLERSTAEISNPEATFGWALARLEDVKRTNPFIFGDFSARSAFVRRGSDPDSARLVADLALAASKQAARLWLDDPATPYPVLLDRAAAQARAVFVAQARDAGA